MPGFRKNVLKEKRADYGKEILQSLIAKLGWVRAARASGCAITGVADLHRNIRREPHGEFGMMLLAKPAWRASAPVLGFCFCPTLMASPSYRGFSRRPTTLRPLAQRVIHKHQRGHGFHHRNSAGENARIVAATAFECGVLEIR